jgi:hypothetical protein
MNMIYNLVSPAAWWLSQSTPTTTLSSRKPNLQFIHQNKIQVITFGTPMEQFSLSFS